jgi:hypothetical protein
VAGEFQGKIFAPVLNAIARELLALMRSDAALRELQGANAARACYFDAQTLGSTTEYTITQARSGSEIFYQLVIMFHETAGRGNYRLDNATLGTGTVAGIPIPSGGGQLVITGNDNIRNFSMLAEAGQTLPFARYLFK